MPKHSWASVLASQAAVATGDALLLLFSILFCLKIYDIFLKKNTGMCKQYGVDESFDRACWAVAQCVRWNTLVAQSVFRAYY